MTSASAGSQRVERAFQAARSAGRIAFVPYVVAGYPDLATSESVALAAIDAGADVLEIGLPYSDPLADGVTLQRATSAALASGATLERSMKLVHAVAAARPGTPLVVMGYANQFLGPPGADNMSARLADAGACGAIVADLTPDEGGPLEEAFARHALALVYLVAPTTSPERAATIAQRSGGFVYCVALSGVTGARRSGPTRLGALVAPLKAVSPLPIAVGFGVSQPAHVQAVSAAGADGVIVGSALVDALGPGGTDLGSFEDMCRVLARATSSPNARLGSINGPTATAATAS